MTKYSNDTYTIISMEKAFKKFLIDTNDLKTNERLVIFKDRFKKSRKTYFRWIKNIKEGKPMKEGDSEYLSVKNKNSRCYFCLKQFPLIVHHIDKNNKNNIDNNLVVLCRNCHSKIHKLLDKNKCVIYSIQMKGGVEK